MRALPICLFYPFISLSNKILNGYYEKVMHGLHFANQNKFIFSLHFILTFWSTLMQQIKLSLSVGKKRSCGEVSFTCILKSNILKAWNNNTTKRLEEENASSYYGKGEHKAWAQQCQSPAPTPFSLNSLIIFHIKFLLVALWVSL